MLADCCPGGSGSGVPSRVAQDGRRSFIVNSRAGNVPPALRQVSCSLSVSLSSQALARVPGTERPSPTDAARQTLARRDRPTRTLAEPCAFPLIPLMDPGAPGSHADRRRPVVMSDCSTSMPTACIWFRIRLFVGSLLSAARRAYESGTHTIFTGLEPPVCGGPFAVSPKTRTGTAPWSRMSRLSLS